MPTIGEIWDTQEKEQRDWAGDYDGTACPNCKRLRMMLCANGRRRCEKCNWDPDKNQYSEYSGDR